MTNFLESLLKGGARKTRKSKTSVMPKRAADQKRLVWNGVIPKTRSGLTKSDLAVSKSGQIVSKKKQAIGKKQHAKLVKSGLAAPPFQRKSRR